MSDLSSLESVNSNLQVAELCGDNSARGPGVNYSGGDEKIQDIDYSGSEEAGLNNNDSSNKLLEHTLKDNLFEILSKESTFKNEHDEKNFNCHFLTRNFIKCEKVNEVSAKNDMELKIKIRETKMNHDEFFKDIENQKLVVIADSIGTGKSWLAINAENVVSKQQPRKWTVRVDLKRLVKEFDVAEETSVNFLNFMINVILKLKNRIEEDAFCRLYNNGNVCIFFDGFDEIALNCTEFPINLFNSFEFNNGNQLWIVTRDNFAKDLQEKLNLDVVYKLEPFTHQNVIDLITSILVFHDLKAKNEIKNEFDIQTQIKNHPNYEVHKEKASYLNNIICGLNTKAIGTLQFYSMIADIYINKCGELSAMTINKTFEEKIKIQYERWVLHKADAEETTTISNKHSLEKIMNIHQFFAMKESYPGVDMFCDLVFDVDEWQESEIMACGILVKKRDYFQFQSKTFRDFFIAQFIIKILNGDEVHLNEKFLSILCDVFTLPKFEVVRAFLDEHFTYYQVIVQKVLPKITKNIEKLDFIFDIFKNNLKNLQQIWMEFFKSLDYDTMKSILFNDEDFVFKLAIDGDLCKKFMELPYALLKTEDLCELVLITDNYRNNFVHLLVTHDKLDTTKFFIENLTSKLDKTHIEKILRSTGYLKRNLLQMSAIDLKDVGTFEYLWNLYRELFESNEEFFSFLMEADELGGNIFHLASYYQTNEIFNFMIEKLEGWTSKQKIREFLSSKGNFKRNLLQTAARENKCLKFNEYLWKIMQKYFSLEEILEMITYTNEYGNNLLHNAVIADYPEIIEFTWNQITATVNSCVDIKNQSVKLEEILKSKGQYGRNLLQNGSSTKRGVKNFENLWNRYRSLFKSNEEFSKCLSEVDVQNNNIFHFAAHVARSEIYEFLIEKLEECTPKNLIKEILRSIGSYNRNLLQSAAFASEFIKINECLWKVNRKYFDTTEMLEMITYKCENGENLLHQSIMGNVFEVIKFTWDQMNEIINSCQHIKDKTMKLEEILKSKGRNGRSLLQYAVCTKEIKIFKYLWNLTRNTFKSNEEFLAYVNQVDENKENIFHHAAQITTGQIFEFLIEQLEECTSRQNIKKYLRILGLGERNLLQTAAELNSSTEFYKCLWRIMRKYFDSAEIFKLITHTDMNGDNLFFKAIDGDNPKIIELTWNEITTIISLCNPNQDVSVKLKEFVKLKGNNGRNLVANAVISSKNIKSLGYLWTILHDLFYSANISAYLFEGDDEGYTCIDYALSAATDEIFNFILNKLEFIEEQELEKFLSLRVHRRQMFLLRQFFRQRASELGIHPISYT